MGSPSRASSESTQRKSCWFSPQYCTLAWSLVRSFRRRLIPLSIVIKRSKQRLETESLSDMKVDSPQEKHLTKERQIFVIGENKVIAGWEKGFSGQCAGENVVMIVPPSLGYGLEGSDKVPANSTLYFLTSLDGIVRVTKPPVGGDCNEGVKARPNQDVTMRIKARVSQPDGRGKIFFDKPSFELRFGKPNAKTLVVGIEKTSTGTCTGEKRLLLLGPALAYGSTGNKNGSVPPNTSVSVEVEVVRVRNKKPESDIGLGFLHDLASGTARLPGGK